MLEQSLRFQLAKTKLHFYFIIVHALLIVWIASFCNVTAQSLTPLYLILCRIACPILLRIENRAQWFPYYRREILLSSIQFYFWNQILRLIELLRMKWWIDWLIDEGDKPGIYELSELHKDRWEVHNKPQDLCILCTDYVTSDNWQRTIRWVW